MNVDRAMELQERSWALQAEGRLNEAFHACIVALRLIEESEGSESPDVANLLTELAEIEHERGNSSAALRLAERAAAIEAMLNDAFTGETAARIRIRTLAALGTIRCAQGDYVRAESPLLDALTMAVAELGECSEDAARAQNNLAVLYKYWGRFDEGLRLYERALASMIAIHGEESLPCAGVYHNLGGILHARGDFAAAEEPGRRAWEISRRLLGEDDPRTMRDAVAYAVILDGLERCDESEPLYRLALAASVKVLGAEHEEVAGTLHNLAAVLAGRGDNTRAEQHYRRALAIRETLFGADHPEVALTCNNLGRLLNDCGRRDEAVVLLERAVAVLEQRLVAGHPHLARARDNLRAARGVRLGAARD